MCPRKCSRKLSVRENSLPHTWHGIVFFGFDSSQSVYNKCRSKWYLRVKSLPHRWHENGFPDDLCWIVCTSRTVADEHVALQYSHAKSPFDECNKNRWRSKLPCDLNDFGQKLHFTWPYWKLKTCIRIRTSELWLGFIRIENEYIWFNDGDLHGPW